MKLDLHIHSKYSYDSFSEPSRIVKKAKRKGLDVISITDHDNMKVYEKLPHKLDIIVVRGMEKKTDMGDVTGLFFKRPITGSDAHTYFEIGRAVTAIEGYANDLEERKKILLNSRRKCYG